MKTAQHFFRKYLFSALGILLLFLLLNSVLLIAIAISAFNPSRTSDIPISALAKLVTVTDQGIETKTNFSKILHEQNAWAMILNDHGEVIWEEDLPAELPRSYTATQIAQFSRWYLQDYPVRVWEHPAGLFVVGYPKNSVIRYTYTTNYDELYSDFAGIGILFLANILLILILFWRNTRRVENAVGPILTGIETMATGKPIHLAEQGELAEINSKLNNASGQLAKKDSARAEWINGISHDIRTPLSIMLGYAGEMEDNDNLSAETRTQAGIIRKQGERLRNLVSDLNLASKLEYSMQPMNKTLISPVELTRQVMSNFLNNGLTAPFDLDLHTDSDVDKIIIEGDKALLERMLENLIRNSITHNPDGCDVVIAISENETDCVISVRDTGSGIPLQLLKRLNSEEIPSPAYNAPGESAHGLGLKLVKKIVKVHYGKTEFANIKPHGLNVKIALPIMDRV